MAWQRWNINENVRVKLNDRGLQVLLAWHAENVARVAELAPRTALGMRPPEADADGYHQFQGWVLMEIFGARMHMGSEPFADMNVLLNMPEMTAAQKALFEADHD